MIQQIRPKFPGLLPHLNNSVLSWLILFLTFSFHFLISRVANSKCSEKFKRKRIEHKWDTGGENNSLFLFLGFLFILFCDYVQYWIFKLFSFKNNQLLIFVARGIKSTTDIKEKFKGLSTPLDCHWLQISTLP